MGTLASINTVDVAKRRILTVHHLNSVVEITLMTGWAMVRGSDMALARGDERRA